MAKAHLGNRRHRRMNLSAEAFLAGFEPGPVRYHQLQGLAASQFKVFVKTSFSWPLKGLLYP